MVDCVQALGPGLRVGWGHSSQECDSVVSEFAVRCHDEGVEVRVLFVLSSFVLFTSECWVFGRWRLVLFDGFGGKWGGDTDVDVPGLSVLCGDDVHYPFLQCSVWFDAVECRDVSFDECVVSVLFDPFVEGVFDVVVSFGAVWSGFAGQTVVCVGVKWLATLSAIGVVLACFVVGVDDDAES